jgi:hypothetical protein
VQLKIRFSRTLPKHKANVFNFLYCIQFIRIIIYDKSLLSFIWRNLLCPSSSRCRPTCLSSLLPQLWPEICKLLFKKIFSWAIHLMFSIFLDLSPSLPWRYCVHITALGKSILRSSTYHNIVKVAEQCWHKINLYSPFFKALKFHLSTDMSADEVHQTGLDEVTRIRGRMHEVLLKCKSCTAQKQMLGQWKFTIIEMNETFSQYCYTFI